MVIALLIEDESSVRGMIRRAVEPDICTVIEAPDGEAGLTERTGGPARGDQLDL